MKKSLQIIEEDPYPIQVTNPDYMDELLVWIEHCGKKSKITLRPEKFYDKTSQKMAAGFALWRAVTPEDIEEIKAGKVIIRNGSFREIRKDENIPSDYDHNYIEAEDFDAE